MLADKDRIFTNLYGLGEWRLAGARRRGDSIRPIHIAQLLDRATDDREPEA